MLLLSVDNSVTKKILPKSVEALQSWDETSGKLPDEAVFAAMVDEIKSALERDNFMTADIAKSFGLIDEVVEKRS